MTAGWETEKKDRKKEWIGMIKVNATNDAGTIRAGQLGLGQQMDSVSKNLQRQIEMAQKQLQELTANKDMSAEEKMKKRQELQKQINELSNQLRQHQMQQKQEALREAKKKQSNDEGLSCREKGNGTGKGGSTGLSQSGMTAILSADTAMSQAQVQGGVAAKMEGKARVLKAEIKQDEALNGDTAKKREELVAVEQTALDATAGQMNTLKEANDIWKEASKEQEGKISSTREADGKEKQEKEQGIGRDDRNDEKESVGTKAGNTCISSIDIYL